MVYLDVVGEIQKLKRYCVDVPFQFLLRFLDDKGGPMTLC